MFHTPNLTGLRKKWIPRRINEGWGLQHMKLYGMDDEVILSGCAFLLLWSVFFFGGPVELTIARRANLSSDYFTNRQDRYHVFSSKELTAYYARIHGAVCSLSFQVLPDPNSLSAYMLDWPAANGTPSPLENAGKFVSHASEVLNPLIHAPSERVEHKPTQAQITPRTLVYPVAQFTPLLRPDTSTEFPAVTGIVQLLSEDPALHGAHWLFTAGYFNVHPVLSNLLIASTAPTKGTVLTASPWANGFYGSSGISGMLPAAYTHLAARFLDRVAAARRSNSIQLKEWRRGTVGQPGGWTYHAKGLWVTLPEEEHPSLTFVGSSNYTKRSYSLDIEIGALVMTSDEQLKKRLGDETRWLQDNAKPVSRDDLRQKGRRVGWQVRLAMWIVERVGGAL